MDFLSFWGIVKLFAITLRLCGKRTVLSAFPVFCLVLKLSVFFAILNYIYLSCVQIHAVFYFNYIIYYGLLIFRCQNVATIGLTADSDIRFNFLCSY